MASLDTYDTAHHPFKHYLGPDEIVLYNGHPDSTVYSRSVGRCFGLFLAALAGWLVIAWQAPHNARTGVLVIGMVILGALGLVLHLRLGAQRDSRRTHYGITEDRLLFLVELPQPRFSAHDLGSFSQVEVTVDRQGVGTIRFGQASRPLWLERIVLPSPSAGALLPAITMVAEVKDVYRMVDDVRKLPSVRRLFADLPPAQED